MRQEGESIMAGALYDFFYWVSGSDDVAEIITIFIILTAICFIILFPLLYRFGNRHALMLQHVDWPGIALRTFEDEILH